MKEISFRTISERSTVPSVTNKASTADELSTDQQTLFVRRGKRVQSDGLGVVADFHERLRTSMQEDLSLLDKFFLFAFMRDLLKYIFTLFIRIGQWFGLFIDMLGAKSLIVKRFLLRQLFWGRGSTFQFTAQILALLMCGFIAITVLYRGNTEVVTGVTAQQYGIVTAQMQADTPSGDLFIQGTTSTTAKAEVLGVQFTDYIVKRGDSLGSIAQSYDISESTLKWANNLKSDLIKPGMKLKIPPGDGLMVTVEKGDTVDTLAERYKGHAESIIEANVLDYPFTLHEGQELFCPECVPPPPPTTVVAQNTVRNYGTPTIYTQPRIPTATTVPAAAGAAGRFLSWPVQNGGAVSRCYTGYHPAIDIADRNLPNLVAAADGTVVFAGCQSGSCPALAPGVLARGGVGLAWMVEIQHDNGYRTAYAHMNRIDVTTGQRVSRGQVIGQLGSSGYSTGPHLHFVLLAPGVTNLLGGINPAPYMQQTGGCY